MNPVRFRRKSTITREFGRKLVVATVGAVLFPILASATPSTTYWAPSTANCQAWAVPHITYDNYFGTSGAYPNDVGLTVGLLPWANLQGEAGFDVLYPGKDPLFLNAKLGIPEGSLFGGSPALSFGIYNVGTQTGVTDYNVLHWMAQKSLPWGGYVAAGVYRGLSDVLFTNSDGDVVKTGAMGALTSPDIQIGLSGLKKINLAADFQSGKNALGGWGVGTYVYFTDSVALLTGPVFFLDSGKQPGGSGWLWTLQLDVDVSLTKLGAGRE